MRTRSAGVAGVLAVLLAACGGAPTGSSAAQATRPQFPMTVENCGQQVTIRGS